MNDFIKSLTELPEGTHKERVEEVMAKKRNKIKDALESIKVRVQRWMLLPYSETQVFENEEIDQLVPYTPRWPLFFHLACATFQMGASAFFHNFYCVNKEACKLLKWDLAGICLMIMGSCTPPFYYGM